MAEVADKGPLSCVCSSVDKHGCVGWEFFVTHPALLVRQTYRSYRPTSSGYRCARGGCAFCVVRLCKFLIRMRALDVPHPISWGWELLLTQVALQRRKRIVLLFFLKTIQLHPQPINCRSILTALCLPRLCLFAGCISVCVRICLTQSAGSINVSAHSSQVKGV